MKRLLTFALVFSALVCFADDDSELNEQMNDLPRLLQESVSIPERKPDSEAAKTRELEVKSNNSTKTKKQKPAEANQRVPEVYVEDIEN